MSARRKSVEGMIPSSSASVSATSGSSSSVLSSSKHYLQASFEEFCHETIEANLKNGGEVFSVRTLKELFMRKARNVEGILLSSKYKIARFKARLKAAYPEIQFADRRNKSQVAFFKSAEGNSSLVIDSKEVMSCSSFESSSDDESKKDNCSSEEEEFDTWSQCSFRSYANEMRDVFMSSILLRNIVEQAPSFQPSTWPPSSEEMSEEKIVSLIPPLLYNTLAWICGLSSEPQEERVHLEQEPKQRILSTAQDILALFIRLA